MALIICPECGHEISEFASHCVYCGCPMEKINELNEKKKQVAENKHFLEKLNPRNLKLVNNFINLLQSVFDPFYKANSKYYLSIGEGYYVKHQIYCWFVLGKNDKLFLRYYKGNEVAEIEFNDNSFQEALSIIVKIYRNATAENDFPIEAKPREVEQPTVLQANISNVTSGSFYIIKNEADDTYFQNMGTGTNFVGRDDIGLANREKYEIAFFTSDISKAFTFFTEEGAQKTLEKIIGSFPKVVIKKVTK